MLLSHRFKQRIIFPVIVEPLNIYILMLFKKEKIFGICKYVLYNKITIPNIKYKYIKYINILAKKLLCKASLWSERGVSKKMILA